MPVSFEELRLNNELNDYSRSMMIRLLTECDQGLTANIIDKSGRIIVDLDSLRELIQIGCEDRKRIDIVTVIEPEHECSCCGKFKVSIHHFEEIVSITIDGMELKIAEPELVDYLQQILKISLDRTYLNKVLEVAPTTEKSRSKKNKNKK